MTDGTAPAIAPDAAMATAISDDDGATNLSRVSGAPFARSQYNRSVFSALLKARAKVGGSKVCIIDADGRELTYDQLVQGAFALGNALKTGTKKGEKVAILLPTGAGAAIAFFALQAYGRIPAMLNFTAGPRALKAACRAAQATTVIT
ncbi:MAG TPA: 2-acylglycerophosphoethanolamine acyltransferase, partial [Alphaproteobacteria bacterium]|nr:2-acylglycerophosphoethanolamine acyltransferase [Alphaproteobacteria bacterium]